MTESAWVRNGAVLPDTQCREAGASRLYALTNNTRSLCACHFKANRRNCADLNSCKIPVVIAASQLAGAITKWRSAQPH
jgi:hypothetical protein